MALVFSVNAEYDLHVLIKQILVLAPQNHKSLARLSPRANDGCCKDPLSRDEKYLSLLQEKLVPDVQWKFLLNFRVFRFWLKSARGRLRQKLK